MERSIEELIREMHQRQQEVVIPKIEKMEKTLYGNGQPGLCTDISCIKTEHEKLKTQVETYTGVKKEKKSDVLAWCAIAVSLVIGCIELIK